MIKHTNLTDVDRLRSLAERDGTCDAIIISERSLKYNTQAGSTMCDVRPLAEIILELSVVIPMSGSAGSRGDGLIRMTNDMIEGGIFRSLVQEIIGGRNFDDRDMCVFSSSTDISKAVPPLGFLLPASVAVMLGFLAAFIAGWERKSRDVIDEESLPLIIGNCSSVQNTEEVAQGEFTKSDTSYESEDDVEDDNSLSMKEPASPFYTVCPRDASQDNIESPEMSCRYFLESFTFFEVYGALKMSVNNSATLHDAADFADKGDEPKQSLIEYVCKYPELRERTVDCLKNKSFERNHVSLVKSIVTRRKSERDSQVGRSSAGGQLQNNLNYL